MKKNIIGKVVAVALLLAAFVVLSLVLPGQHNLKCDECGGSGYGYVRGSGGDRIKTGCNTCHGSGDCKNPKCKNGNVPA